MVRSLQSFSIVSARSRPDSEARGPGTPCTPHFPSNFVRLADREEAAVGAGDGAPDQEQVVGRIDPDDAEVPDGDPGVAILARLANPLAGVRRVGAGARGAGVAVHPLDAVAGAEALEAVPLDHPREAPPFARADDVDVLDRVEDLDRERLPLGHAGDVGPRFLTDLAHIALGLGVDLAGVTPLGLGRDLPLLIGEAELERDIAVAVFGTDLEDRARPAFQDRDRHGGAVGLENLGHADFTA